MAPRLKTGMDLLIVVMLQVVSFGLLVGWNNQPSSASIPDTATVAKTDELEEVNINGLSHDVLAGHGDLVNKPTGSSRIRQPEPPPTSNDVRPVGFATNRGVQPLPPAKIY